MVKGFAQPPSDQYKTKSTPSFSPGVLFIETACFISLHAHQHSPHDAAEKVGVTGDVISLTRDEGQIGIPFEMFERKTAGVWPD